MSTAPYEINWSYVRASMRVNRGGDSYRSLAERFPKLSATTCYRFLRREQQLDLVSLLSVMTVLGLHPTLVIVQRTQQLELMPRGRVPGD